MHNPISNRRRFALNGFCELLEYDQQNTRRFNIFSGFYGRIHRGFYSTRKAFFFSVLWLLTTTATADWTWQPFVQAGFDYNDNFNLTPVPLEVWRSYFSGRVRSKYREEQWGINFDGTYRGSRYIDHDEIDQDEGFVNLFGDYSSEYSTWELAANVSRDQPASSQLQAGNQVFNRIDRFIWSLAPAWNWNLSERSRLRIGYVYSSTAYSQAPTVRTTRSDYFTHTGSMLLSHQLYESTQVFSQWNLIETVNDTLGFKSDQYILSMGVQHSLSDTFQFTVSGGGLLLVSELQTSRLVFDPTTFTFRIVPNTIENTQSGYILNLSVSKSFENSTLSGSFDRNLSPAINGGQVELYRLRVNGRHRLTDRFSAILDINAFKSSAIQGTVTQNGQTRVFAKAFLQWEFSQNWNLDFGYWYGFRESENSNNAANRNSVFISLNYEWDPLNVLR